MTTMQRLDNAQRRWAEWPSRPLDENTDQLLSALEAGMPVALIATFDLKACEADEIARDVLDRPELQDFDHIPVRHNGTIIGLLNRFVPEGNCQRVRDVMQPLDESILISAEAGILTFVEDADQTPCRLVLRGRSICGIVTLSDLQKLAVRVVVFSHITHLELLLAQWLRQNSTNDEWMTGLSGNAQEKINGQWEQLLNENLAIDKITATTLRQKIKAALALDAFNAIDDAKKKLSDVGKLRNSIAHAHDCPLTQKTAKEVAASVRAIRELMGWLRTSLRQNPSCDSC